MATPGADPSPTNPTTATVVVGVDGSEPARRALAWAAGQARRAGATLVVVMAWEMPPSAYWAGLPPAELDLGEATARMIDAEVEEVLGATPGVEIRPVVVNDRAGPALVREAKGAELLVVGTRGHGAVTGAILGSVSEHCIAHAPCPVVVVRPGTAVTA